LSVEGEFNLFVSDGWKFALPVPETAEFAFSPFIFVEKKLDTHKPGIFLFAQGLKGNSAKSLKIVLTCEQ